MNLRRSAFFLALAISHLAHGEESAIQFAGVMTAGGKTRIALTDPTTKVTTWLEPGAEFNGYTIARYDPKEEAVFLKKGGRETRLAMVAAKTPDTSGSAKDSAAQTAQSAQAVAIRSNLRQLASAARQYQLERGVNTVNYAGPRGSRQTHQGTQTCRGRKLFDVELRSQRDRRECHDCKRHHDRI